MNILIVTNMYPTPEMPSFGTFVHDQVQALRKEGVSVDVLFFNGRESTWNYVWAFFRFWWRLLWLRYDVIHAHYVLAGIVARAQWGHRVVLTHHGPEVLGHPRWQSLLCRLVTPLFDEVIHVTEQVRRALADEDGWVIPCGIDYEVFTPQSREDARARLGLPLEKPLVLWAGEHWRPEKRFDLVEQAMNLVEEALPESELILLSGKAHTVVPDYMAACDALILTSEAEGSPMVVKEAMACNLPVVSVRVGDVPEVIGTTPGCALVERNPADIAAKLVLVLRARQRTDGRSRIEHLRNDRIAERLLQVYSRALQPRRGKHFAESYQ